MKNSMKFISAVIFLFATLCSLPAKSQQSLIKVNGWNAYVHLPADYSTTTKAFPTIIFFPGIGEVGANASAVITNGPGAYITQGWNGNVSVDGSTVEFIVISLQPPATYPVEITMNAEIQTLKNLYRIDNQRLYLTGLSMGGWCATTFVTGDPYGGPYTYASQVAAVVTVEGMKPDDNSPYPNLFDNFAKSGGRYLGFEQAQDGRDTKTVVDRMNATKANSGIYVQTNYGGGGHCCWEQFYGGSGTVPPNYTLDGVSQNIYQWMARQSLGTQTIVTTGTPTANAGTDQTIKLPTSSITLAGSGSETNGTIASYAWSKVSGPTSGTIASVSSATTVINSLAQGTYTFALKVTDKNGVTASDNVIVTVNAATNQAPTANAGADQTIKLPITSITLAGSGTDADGTITGYAWSKVSGPTSGTIVSASSATTVINSLAQGTYTFALKVTDNSGATATDNVVVTVNAATNQAPTANAGADQIIKLPTNTVTLRGAGTDADGTIAGYAWSKVSGPTSGTIVSASSATTVINSLAQGTYTFALKVTDNSGATATDNVVVTVNAATNQAPKANAGADQIIKLPTSTVTLTGSGTDADGTIASYKWSKSSGPSGSTIVSTSSATTVIKGLAKGTYIFSLKVTDNKGSTATDNITITVNAATTDQSPTANAGVDKTITLPTNSVTLTGSGTDPDGTIAGYTWSKVSGPTGGAIVSASSATTVINSLTQGTYTFSLKVTDNGGATATDNVVVTVNTAVVNQLPVVNAGSDLIITLPTNSTTLTGSATSSGKTIAAYLWSEISGPSTAALANVSSATATASNLALGQYKFSLKATDNSGTSAIDTVLITINAATVAAQGSCNTKAPVTYTLSSTSGDIYRTTPDPAWKGGDTIKIVAGNYAGVIEFDHLHGDPCHPIVIINGGGLVSTTLIRLKTDCEYVHITGTGMPGIPYGFKTTAGPVAIDYGHHIEIDHIEISNGDLGFYIKSIPDTTMPVTVFVAGSANNYVLNRFYVHHCWVHDIHGEGMYIGHTAPDGGDGQTGVYPNGKSILPIRMDSVEIAYNLVERTDWDGIQLSNARDGAKIHDNIVRNFGLINKGDQQCGIILGGNTRGDVYNNTVIKGSGNGIELFGYGTLNCYNNYVDSTGYDNTTSGQESIFANDIPIVSEPSNPKQQIVIYADTINHPMPKGAIRVGAYYANSLASNVHDNKFCIPGAPATWQSTYIALNPVSSINSNNVLACLTGGRAVLAARPDNTAANSMELTVQNNAIALRIYPNPVQSSFTVELDAGSVNQDASIQLVDLQGRILYQKNVQVVQQVTSIKIDMSKFNDGFYLLNVKTASKNITEKIIKASH